MTDDEQMILRSRRAKADVTEAIGNFFASRFHADVTANLEAGIVTVTNERGQGFRLTVEIIDGQESTGTVTDEG